jgi:hypothetical protein
VEEAEEVEEEAEDVGSGMMVVGCEEAVLWEKQVQDDIASPS